MTALIVQTIIPGADRKQEGVWAVGLSIQQLFQDMLQSGASDLHLSGGARPAMRVDGQLLEMKHSALGTDQVLELVRPLLSEAEHVRFLQMQNVDFSVDIQGLSRFRGNLFVQLNGTSAVFRAIPHTIPSLEQLATPQIFKTIASYPHGLVLVTGPTGSGKSTTLAAFVHELNTHQNIHILSIEDPIEYIHPKHRALVTQRQVGVHTPSFAEALRAALREDPDVILVGELRDAETIALALTAAETGHLVLATLHTNNAIKTVDRILDSFPADAKDQIRSMLSESLRAVIAQRLLPKAQSPGRIAAYEVMVVNHAIANLIRENETVQIKNSMLSGRAEGMRLLDQSIADLHKAGLISGETAFEHAEDRTPYARFSGPAPAGGSFQPTQARTQTPTTPRTSPTPAPQPAPHAAPQVNTLSPMERLKRLKKSA